MLNKIVNFFLQNVLPNEVELQHVAINHVRKYSVEDLLLLFCKRRVLL